MQGYFLEFEPHTVICHEGDPATDLYFLKSGRLLICTIHGTQVKCLARIEAGEFVGELSFFDGRPRSSYVITEVKSELIQVPKQEISGFLPDWYQYMGKNLTKKIRLLDHVIQESNTRLKSKETKPLSIEEQRIILELVTNRDT